MSNAQVKAFVDGVRWWEFQQTSGTLWGSDRNAAEKQAVERYSAKSNAKLRHYVSLFLGAVMIRGACYYLLQPIGIIYYTVDSLLFIAVYGAGLWLRE